MGRSMVDETSTPEEDVAATYYYLNRDPKWFWYAVKAPLFPSMLILTIASLPLFFRLVRVRAPIESWLYALPVFVIPVAMWWIFAKNLRNIEQLRIELTPHTIARYNPPLPVQTIHQASIVRIDESRFYGIQIYVEGQPRPMMIGAKFDQIDTIKMHLATWSAISKPTAILPYQMPPGVVNVTFPIAFVLAVGRYPLALVLSVMCFVFLATLSIYVGRTGGSSSMKSSKWASVLYIVLALFIIVRLFLMVR